MLQSCLYLFWGIEQRCCEKAWFRSMVSRRWKWCLSRTSFMFELLRLSGKAVTCAIWSDQKNESVGKIMIIIQWGWWWQKISQIFEFIYFIIIYFYLCSIYTDRVLPHVKRYNVCGYSCDMCLAWIKSNGNWGKSSRCTEEMDAT